VWQDQIPRAKFPRPQNRSPQSSPGHPEWGLRSLGGGLRSWLAVRLTCTPALYLTAPPLLRLAASVPGTRAPRGVPRRGLWREADIASSGTGSERAKVASVAAGKPPASRRPRSLKGARERTQEGDLREARGSGARWRGRPCRGRRPGTPRNPSPGRAARRKARGSPTRT